MTIMTTRGKTTTKKADKGAPAKSTRKCGKTAKPAKKKKK